MDPARDGRLMKRTFQVLLVLFGAGVSLAAFIAVVQGWHTFNAKVKFVAVEFLCMLILYPAVVAKTGKQSNPARFSSLVVAYTLILMALIVFAAH
jgi:uncharacterized membrane protein